MSGPDYTRLLRLHAARWTVVFAVLTGAWVGTLCVSLLFGNFWPLLLVSIGVVLAVCICRIEYVQLRDAEDEALISALRESMRDL